MKHIGTLELKTKRLILRRFEGFDIQTSFKNWTNDEETTRYLTWKPHGDITVTQKVIGGWINSYNDTSFYQWAIVLKDNNECIGTISVVEHRDDIEEVELGYCIGSLWWNQGYMSEALKRVIAFFFEEVGMNRILAVCDSYNHGSYKVMEKSGMSYEGTLRQAGKNNYGIVDLKVYSILKSEYKNSSIKDGTDYINEVKDLIISYSIELNRDLSFQNLDEELQDIKAKYCFPKGELLVYEKDNKIVGIVAYQGLSDMICEMKRLYVLPEYRNSNAGKQLILSIMEHAKKAGYKEMVLDTIVPLQAAIHLYKKYGFEECYAYYDNPMEDVIYMKKEL